MTKELMLNLGYKEDEIEKIINTYPLFNLKEKTLRKKVKENYYYLIVNGYTKEEIIKISKMTPAIYSYSIEHLKTKIKDLMSLGYSKEDVIKISKQAPQIYGLSTETIKQKLEDIMLLGYNKQEVLMITKKFPGIYSLSIENIKQKIEDMISLGYTKQEVLEMTKKLPAIYGLSINNLREKIKYYDRIGLHEVAIIDSKQLMQSVELSYARYEFFKEAGLKIDLNNYHQLFKGQKIFQKQHGITKEELLTLYNYHQKNNIKVKKLEQEK